MVSTTADSSEVRASVPVALVAIWSEYASAAREYARRRDGLIARECSLRAISEDSQYLAALGGSEAELNLHKVADRFFRLLVAEAEKAFAPAGAKLSIPQGEVRNDCEAANPEQFDAAKLWEFLVEKYGVTGRGAQVAFAQAAGVLRKHCGELDSSAASSSVKTVTGRAVLTLHTWGGASHLYSYDTGQIIQQVLPALGAVLQWAGTASDNLPERIAEAVELLNYASRLPERFHITDALLVVPFKSKIELRLSPQCAESLRLFLSEFPG